MKKRIKIKRIEEEIKSFTKDRARIDALKQKQTKELALLVLILVLIISIFSRNIVVYAPLKIIFDFIIYTFVSMVILKEVYAEFIDKYPVGNAKHNAKFKFLVFSSIFIYILIFVILFYERIKNIF